MRTSTASQSRPARKPAWRVGLWIMLCVMGLVSALASLAPTLSQAQSSARTALVVPVEGVIGPALAYRVRGALEDAATSHDLIVLEMNTPGGLDSSMRQIISDILASRVPVVSYVSPKGSRAASAGTYILYASHIAAMVPGSVLGAATPVQIGGGGGEQQDDAGLRGSDRSRMADEAVEAIAAAFSGESAEQEEDNAAEDSQPADTQGMSALEKKVVNDAAAYIRGLAELRGRNAEWAEQAVREGVSLTAEEAIEINVIDVVADDLRDLFARIDGRSVDVEGRGSVTLDTEGLEVVRAETTWIEELLEIITDPNIALILMQIGVLGLIIEFYNPGAAFPGVIGLVCLVLGLIALSVLPVSAGGIALLVIGTLFMVLEFFVASGGVLAIMGVISFGIGAFFLFDTDVPAFQVSIWTVLITTAIMGGIVVLVGGYALAQQRKRVTAGAETLIGMRGRVTTWDRGTGFVMVDGEDWRAEGPVDLTPGQEIMVTNRKGSNTLVVRAV